MENSVEMPRYKCYKEVHALKIANLKDPIPVEAGGSGKWAIIPEETGYGPVLVSDEYVKKHNPQIGGYYVIYKDGYQSFSPAKAFEEGYTRI